MVEQNEEKYFTRKAQSIGKSLLISLPKKWTKLFNIKEKQKLHISIDTDYALRIVPDALHLSEEPLDEIKVDFYPEVGKEVFEKCLSGTKKIRIISEKPIEKEHLAQIRYFIGKLPTTMITTEKPQEIIIHNLGVKDVPSEEILRGLFAKTLDLFENIRENDSKEKDYNIGEINIHHMLLIQYARTYLTTGYLNQNDFKDFNAKKASDYREISNALRDISYILYDMDFHKEGLAFFNKIEDYFKETYDSFRYKGDDREKKAYRLYFKNLWDEGTLLKKRAEGELKFMTKELLRVFHKCSDILSIISILD